jgi:hypothetical protein
MLGNGWARCADGLSGSLYYKKGREKMAWNGLLLPVSLIIVRLVVMTILALAALMRGYAD